MAEILQTERVLELARRQGLIRPRDVEAIGVAREYLLRLHREGQLRRVGRGVYVSVEASLTEHHSLAVVAKVVPHGVVCLLSALRFHQLTTQNPHEVWISIAAKARRPALRSPALCVVRSSGAMLTEGVEEVELEGVPVRIYGVAKTIADCFKYRRLIGLDVALEALREALRAKRATVDEIYRYAVVCRVANVIRPYLESII